MSEFESIIKNTNAACSLCERAFSHNELLNVIKGENDLEKQICILKLEKICSQEEASLLIKNLTNQHGIIREAIAFKINEFMKMPEFCVYFQSPEILDIFLDAIIDMNPNICRQIIEVLPYIKNKYYFFRNLFEKSDELIQDAKTMNRRNKGYVYSKKVFKIFWYLDSIAVLGYFEDKTALKTIIEKTYNFEDYTIREKCAKILSSLPENTEFVQFCEKLSKDENYFVRRLLSHD